MANEITGREVVVGFEKATTWHTPVACGAGDGMLIRSDGIKVTVATEPDDSAGQEWIQQADAGLQELKGQLKVYGRYRGLERQMALIMGTAGAPAQQGATAAYLHTLQLATNIIGKFGTLAQLKLSNKVWEYPSVKLHGFKLTAKMNKPVDIDFDTIADKLDRASATNTTVTMANVTMPDVANRIIMNKDTVVRINDQSAAALDDTMKIYPSEIEISFNRPMDSEPVAGQEGVDEPTDNGFPVGTITMKFPRYNTANDAFFTDWDSFTSKKMDITFTGKTIESTYKYQWKFSFTHLKIDNPEAPVNGAGKIPFSLKFNVYGAAAAPTGMAFTEPFQLAIISTLTTDPLA
ncbi:MAG: hypothetical protein ACYCYR_09610 [Desulfobulbaceae bacterium]